MSDDVTVALVPTEPVRVDLGVIRADKPAELVKFATEAANALAGVIESRKLYSNIQGKRFVKCEGWTTLAAMLGVTPHEIGVVEAPEGVFTATVELRRLTDGQPVSRASAECGAPDEVDRSGKPLWASRARYARRSMALTRATAKACRLAFSWVMVLAGFQPTPEEEIPMTERGGASRATPSGAGAQGTTAAPTPQPLSEKPAAIAEPEPMPWDGPAGFAMPFGPEKGKPLGSLDSQVIVGAMEWAKKKGKFTEFCEAAETVLAGRDGE